MVAKLAVMMVVNSAGWVEMKVGLRVVRMAFSLVVATVQIRVEKKADVRDALLALSLVALMVVLLGNVWVAMWVALLLVALPSWKA